jgi:hypothetical protein
MLKLAWAAAVVVFTLAAACGVVWLAARLLHSRGLSIGKRFLPAPAAGGVNRMQERMRYFEQRMFRLEQLLDKSWHAEGSR